LWCVVKGFAVAPPRTELSVGVSTSMKSRSSSHSRSERTMSARARNTSLHVGVVGDEVDVALAVARLDLAHAEPLARDGREALGERAQGRAMHRELARRVRIGSALDQHDVAEVDLLEQREVLAHLPRRAEELDLPGAVAQLDEHQLARVAQRHDPPRDAVVRVLGVTLKAASGRRGPRGYSR
jgi:hypothetical protein